MSAERPISLEKATDAWTALFKSFVRHSMKQPGRVISFGFETDRDPSTVHLPGGMVTTVPIIEVPNTGLPKTLALFVICDNVVLARATCTATWVNDKPILEQMEFGPNTEMGLTGDALIRLLIATGMRLEQPGESL